MHGKITDFTYIPGGKSQLVQGVKRGHKPKNAVAGGNGSWIVKEPASVILKVVDEHGKHNVINVTSAIRKKIHVIDGKTMSKTRVEDIINRILNTEVELTDDGKEIVGFYDLICD